MLPQYLANLTLQISTKKTTFFAKFALCTSNNVYARFEVFRTLPCVFISVFKVFVRCGGLPDLKVVGYL